MNEFNFSIEVLRLLHRQKAHSARRRHKKALSVGSQAAMELQDAAIMLEAGRYLIECELAKGITDSHLASLRNSCLVLENRWRERQAELIEAQRVIDLIQEEITTIEREGKGLDRFLDHDRCAHWQSIRNREQKLFEDISALANVSDYFLPATEFKSGTLTIIDRHSD